MSQVVTANGHTVDADFNKFFQSNDIGGDFYHHPQFKTGRARQAGCGNYLFYLRSSWGEWTKGIIRPKFLKPALFGRVYGFQFHLKHLGIGYIPGKLP